MSVEVILYFDPVVASGLSDFGDTFPDPRFNGIRQEITEGSWLIRHDGLTQDFYAHVYPPYLTMKQKVAINSLPQIGDVAGNIIYLKGYPFRPDETTQYLTAQNPVGLIREFVPVSPHYVSQAIYGVISYSGD